jgi:SAM-dependent methyltransferase
LSWNWNFRIALFYILHEIRGEKKYGIDTTGFDELKTLQKQGIDISHATIYMPVNFFLIEKVMDEINKQSHNKIFLDIGCGKGRAMAVAAHYGFKKITGIDFSKKFIECAEANMDLVKKKIPDIQYKVILQDAFYYEIPSDVTFFFLFNPFDEVIMSKVVSNILQSQIKNPRTIWVAYISPLYKDLFSSNGFSEIFVYKKISHLRISFFEKRN